MSGLPYYKTLISDDEVIQALIKESKLRDGIVEKVRVRPNINFLQRTVSNLVSSNKRITMQQKLITEAQKTNVRYRKKIPIIRRKTPHQLIQEIMLSERIKFVKSSEKYEVPKFKDQNGSKTPSMTNTVMLNESRSSRNTDLNCNKGTSRNNSSQDTSIILLENDDDCFNGLKKSKSTTSNVLIRTKLYDKSKRKHSKKKSS